MRSAAAQTKATKQRPGRLVTVRQDVLTSILERLDEVSEKLDRIEGRVPPPAEPTLRELAIRAAKGTPRDHNILIERIEREVGQGRDRGEVMKEIREAL